MKDSVKYFYVLAISVIGTYIITSAIYQSEIKYCEEHLKRALTNLKQKVENDKSKNCIKPLNNFLDSDLPLIDSLGKLAGELK